MRVRRAIILAAGQGARLGERLTELPKPLLPLASTTLLGRQLEQFRTRGVEQVTVVVGHLGDRIRETLARGGPGLAVECVDNPAYAESGSGWSLLQAAQSLEDGEPVLLTHGDIVYADEILEKCLAVPDASALAVDLGWRRVTGDEVLAWSLTGRARGVVKGDVPEAHDAAGEFIGLNVLTADFGRDFCAFCRQRLAETRRWNYEEPLLNDFLHTTAHPCRLSGTRGVKWINVNYADDLEYARRHFG